MSEVKLMMLCVIIYSVIECLILAKLCGDVRSIKIATAVQEVCDE